VYIRARACSRVYVRVRARVCTCARARVRARARACVRDRVEALDAQQLPHKDVLGALRPRDDGDPASARALTPSLLAHGRDSECRPILADRAEGVAAGDDR
jgi:hypothetical protein